MQDLSHLRFQAQSYKTCSSVELFSSQDFVMTVSLLVMWTDEDRFNWTFSLYDTNGDGFISREEMMDVAQSVRYGMLHQLRS